MVEMKSSTTSKIVEISHASGSIDRRDLVAAAFNTLPRFVSISDDGHTVTVLQEVISENVSDGNIDFVSFREKYAQLFPDVSEEEMLKLWVSMNPTLSDSMMAYYVQTTVGDVLDIQDFIDNDLSSFETDIDRSIAALLARVQSEAKLSDRLGPKAVRTQFISHSASYTETSTTSVPLDILFDTYTPSDKVPMAMYAGISKYAVNFTVPKDTETPQESDNIVFKHVSESGSVDVTVTGTDAGTVIQFSVVVEESPDAVLRDMHACLGTDLSDRKLAQNGVQGMYYFIGYAYDYTTFADFVMNDVSVSPDFSLGEFSRASPIKAGMATRVHNTRLDVTGVISSKKFDSSSPDAKHISALLSVGDPYIRLFVSRANTESLVEAFGDAFAQILYLYYDEYDSIYNLYRTYIPTLRRVDLQRRYTVPEPVLEDPELFVANYSRVCANMPVRVADGVTPEHVIEFPKNSGELYTCTDPVYKYPGVKSNTKLSNVDKFPFIPCCYKQPQENKPKYKEYYGTGKRTRQKQIRMITTNKVLEKDFFGVLPDAINTLLTSVDIENSYVRLGVDQSLSSFLECLNTATGMSISRKDISALIDPVVCVQENPGVKMRDIVYSLDSEDVYLDPRRYVKLLEYLFRVDIYIFDIDGIVIPNHAHGYYTYTRDESRPTVIVYEHRESERCELVSRWDTTTGVYHSVYSGSSDISVRTHEVFTYCNAAFSGNVKITPITVPSYAYDATAQYIDMYGKTRGLSVRIGGNTVYVEVTPMPPLALPMTSRVYENSPDTENLFIDKYAKYINAAVDGVTTTFPKHNTSQVVEALDNYRIAQQLCESVKFLFSGWMHETRSSNVSRFVKEKMTVHPQTDYILIGPETSDTHRLFRDGKIALPTREAIERLMFVLRHALIRDRKKLDTYYKQKYFENYYNSIDSFRTGDFILTPALETVEQDRMVAFSGVSLDDDEYFTVFRNSLYRAHVIDSIPGNATVYVYNSQKDIRRVKRGSGHIVLVYMVNGNRQYVRLSRVR